MRLLLIRHGETVDNVAGLYAGSRDSELTNHGVLQAQQLGEYLASSRPKITHFFSSTLRRAVKTATALEYAQTGLKSQERDASFDSGSFSAVTQVKDLCEQDFGFYEGKPWYAREVGSNKTGKEIHHDAHKDDPGFQDVESKDSLAVRCDSFLNKHLIPLLDYDGTPDELFVTVVSHGILLSHLWRRLLLRLPRNSLTIAPEIVAMKGQVVLEHLGGWRNTGFLELSIRHCLLDFPALSSDGTTPLVSIGSGSRAAENAADRTVVESSKTMSLPLPSKNAGSATDIGDTASPSIQSRVKPAASEVQDTGSTEHSTQIVPEQPLPEPFSVPSEHKLDDPRSDGFATLQSRADNDLPTSTVLLEGFSTHILTVNGQDHLRGLKRTRGGIGSARHDEGQKSIQSFFKRAKQI